MRRGVAHLLFAVVYVPVYGLGLWLLETHEPNDSTAAWTTTVVLLCLAALVSGLVVHELGHALAVRLAGGRVSAICLFSPPARVTLHVGALPVSFGFRLRGQVEYPGGLSVMREAVVTAAGPLAGTLTAPLWLLLPGSRWLGLYVAFISLTSGLRDFAPGTGEYESDGYKLFRFPARLRAEADVRDLLGRPDWSLCPDAADRLITGYWLDIPQALACMRDVRTQPDLLLRLYAQPWNLPKRPERDFQKTVHGLSWQVLVIRNLPRELADLASERVEWVLKNIDEFDDDAKSRQANARHTLAVARLRQGKPRKVRSLCEDALARDDLDADDRASVLATLAMAKHARLLSGEEELEEALALDPNADLVAEAVAVLRSTTAQRAPIRPIPC